MKAGTQTSRPGEQVREHSFILTEGQRDDFVEVIAIDENAGAVTLRNSGTLVTLTFEKDGPKLPRNVPAPPVPGVVPGAPGQNLSPPQSDVTVQSNPAAATYESVGAVPGARQLPTRTPRVNVLNTDPLAGASTLPQGGSANPGAGVSRSGPVQGGSVPQPWVGATQGVATPIPGSIPSAPYQGPRLSPEEQSALLEIERQMNQQNAHPGDASGPTVTYPDPRTLLTPDRPPVLPQ